MKINMPITRETKQGLPTYRENIFAHKYIEYKGNATKAYADAYTPEHANTNAYLVLNRDRVKKKITELLPTDEKDAQIIQDAMNAQRNEKISWNDLHAYLETSLKLKGLLHQDKNTNQVAIIINES